MERIRDAGSVGETVQRLILRSGLSMRKVAKRAGVSETSLHQWCSGQTGAHAYSLVNVLDALGYEIIVRKKEEKT